MALVTGSAAGAGNKKLVAGTVYDTTCATGCVPECPPPPHCGPITAMREERIVCPMSDRMIACPLSRASVIVCVQAEGCPGTTNPPVYSGEGAVVKVRKRGSPRVLVTVPIVEGHFTVRLAPGEYMTRPHLPDPQCWTGTKIAVRISAKLQGPVPASIWVEDRCISHP
jgi:hypothetical protein